MRPWADVLWDAVRACGAPAPHADARVSELLNAIEDHLGLDTTAALSTARRVQRAAHETDVEYEAPDRRSSARLAGAPCIPRRVE